MIVGITGSTGLIGSALSEYLRQHGHTAVAIFRNELSFIIPPKLDALIHLAGESIASGTWNEEKKSRIFNSRVVGTKNLISALMDLPAPPKTLISASAIGIYGDRGEEILTEKSSTGNDFLANVATEWERAAVVPSLRCVQARFGIVLSPKGGALKTMLPPFRWGLGAIMGDGKQYMSWVSLADTIRALYHLLTRDNLHGPYNITAPNPLRNEEFSQRLAALCNKKLYLKIPRRLITMIAGEAASVVLSSQRALPEKILSSGFAFNDNTFISTVDY